MRTYERSCWCVKQRKQMALVFIIIAMILQFWFRGCVGCRESERVGLLQLKSYLKNVLNVKEESIMKSWSHDASNRECCLWTGVTCSDATGGHIVHLSVNEILLYEDLDSDAPLSFNLSLLHSFPELQSLNLSSNGFDHLFDPIYGHKSFQRLRTLRTLDLSNNRLNNSVLPFLSGARSIRILNIGGNSLEGVFPPNELASITELKELNLMRNEFSFFSLQGLVLPSSLQVLNLQGNQLSSTPKGFSQICAVINLRELDLSNNSLTSLPYCLSNLTRLRTLVLSHNQLNGNLSSFVSGLPSELEYLSLLDNNFNGSFLFRSLVNQTRLTVFKLSSKVGMIQVQAESSWVPLFQLKILMLQSFILGSKIPGFLVHQHDLWYLDLSHNNLTGAFPTWLVQNNTGLETFLLNSNSFTELQLPRLIHELQVLDISSNKIGNAIQEDIGNVFLKLRYLNLSSNHFRGTIPSSMGKMKSLETLDMSFNGLLGQLPKTFLSGCYSLWFLKLSNNQFQGELFPEYANPTGLAWLFLDGNKFNGSLGKGLSKSKNLSLLEISDNNISGSLPLWMGKLSNLLYLYMRGNQLKGSFPRQLQNLHKLKVIELSHNSFSGSLPWNVDFPFLKELRLHSNEFVGTIPDVLFNAEELEVLNLGNNNFSGTILNTIGKKSLLRVIILRNNSLQNYIPEKMCLLSKVSLLDLSGNNFKGIIPSCLANMSFGSERYDGIGSFDIPVVSAIEPFSQKWSYTSALNLDEGANYSYQVTPSTIVDYLTKSRYETYHGDILHYLYGVDLSSNQLSGEIPIDIGNLRKIKSLNLSSNRLTGSIPDSISKLNDIESLDLSNNRLEGNIPLQLADLNNLGVFNVSRNNLSGEIPFKGHLGSFDEKSYIGNVNLCGLPTNISCNSARVPEPNASKQSKEEEEESDGVIDMVWFYWTSGAVYISTLLALYVFLCIDSRWSREWFYQVDLIIHHLQRVEGRFFRK